MSSDIRLSTLPSNRIEALTMLYLQNQDLSSLSPEEIFDKHIDAYTAIKKKSNESKSGVQRLL